MSNNSRTGKATAQVKFIYNMCNDLEAMRTFYTDLVGLEQGSFRNDEEWGWLVYKSEGFEMMFFRAEKEISVRQEWACQPGYEGGTLEVTSWSIRIPEDAFPEVVSRVKSAGVRCLAEKPEWRQDCYWGFTAMDPMGNTVELYTEPKERPASTEWPSE
jgi:catechol 2,3-dioxygenase-like lactoylglutathione lyase family enzyme